MRQWIWTEDNAEYNEDPESPQYGNFLRMNYFALAGQPRLLGDPTDLVHVRMVEEVSGARTFAMNGFPYADQAAIVLAYNESTGLERLHLNALPNEP